jgi:hypothetical protein
VEIIDYLSRNRRTVVLFVAVPVAGAAIAATIAGLRPPGYVGKTIVAAPALVGGSSGQYSGAQAPQQFVNAFVAASTTPAVVNRVVADAHVSYGSIVNGTSVSETGSSPVLTVSYTGQHRPEVGAVAEAVARETLAFLFGSQVTLAQQSLTDATNQYDTLQQQAASLSDHTNGIAPDQAAANLDQAISALQQQQAQQLAAGEAAAASSLGSAIAAEQHQLQAMAPTVSDYQRVADQLDNARTSMQNAQQQLDLARQQQSAADPGKVLFARKTHKAPRVGPTLRVALPAAGVGILLAAGLVLLMEGMGRRERDPDPADTAAITATHRDGDGSGDVLIGAVPGPRNNGHRP